MLQVNWVKNTQQNWLPFPSVNLSGVQQKGVYIIWRLLGSGYQPRVVRVGQGDIAVRLNAHMTDYEVTNECKKGIGAWVTWAAVPANYLDGVETYLADCYKPLVGERFPDARPIAVNLPI